MSNFLGWSVLTTLWVLLVAYVIVIFGIVPKFLLWVVAGAWVLIIIVSTLDVFIHPLIPVERVPANEQRLFRSNREASNMEYNAVFEVNCNRDIHSYWVYGIKFDKETNNVKFAERFRDGLVPVVFHEKKKGSNTFEVRIIGKKFVPEELLCPGSEFLVEDNDQFICRGVVTRVVSEE